jgi:signal transduction histidine kinase
MLNLNPSQSSPGIDGAPAAMHDVKILLVDDLKENLLALEGQLRRADVAIYTASSGAEALDLLLLNDFAVALIDVRMPCMSGFELAEFMRGTKKTKNVPIIFVTATARDQSFEFKGYESGAVDYLPTPCDKHAVRSKVNIFIEFFRQKMELENQLETITKNHRDQDELLSKLKKTQVELEQAVRIRDEFMSIASHELKTPLTSLKLQSQMRQENLREKVPLAFTPERLEKMFKADEKQLERIKHLVDDMLDISRISSGKLSLRLEEVDLCEMVRSLIGRSTEQFKEAGCSIHIETCQSATAWVDRFRMEQVVLNLLTNAMRYGAGKPVSVQVLNSQNGIRIVVRDQGRGIAEHNLDRIFLRFERAVPGSEISGLGLGLYIVKEILEAHQASISVQSEPGKGSAFIVELPEKM